MKKAFNCQNCSKEYQAVRSDSRFCSIKCKDHVYYLRNRDKRLSNAKKWHADNKGSLLEHARTYYNKNKGYYKSKAVMRIKKVLKATPKWVDKVELAAIYDNCPQGYHVDHIIPLQGKNVSGLHVAWNLQYLPAKENLVKSNKVAPCPS